MLWFKHKSNARRDPMIVKAIERFGLDGYAAYFIILELMAENCDHKMPGKLVISCSQVRQELAKKSTSIQLLLNFYMAESKLTWERKDDDYIIYLPKFKDYADRYTRRKIKDVWTHDGGKCGKRVGVEEKRRDKNSYTNVCNNLTARAHARPPGFTKIKEVVKKLLRKREEERGG